MSGLDEAIEAVRGSVGSPGRFSDEDCLRVIRAAAPALLKAVVAEMADGELGGAWAMGTGYWHDTRNIPQPSRGPESGASTGMCFPAAMRINLEISLLAALARLGRKEEG